ncbi:ATP-dependent DNA ligase [Streptomyces syringium]|uniref:ATP-dependent DNA ligase n=1 Tax=Streptomyces syringium TaxID=76729 RepID=UPI001AE89740
MGLLLDGELVVWVGQRLAFDRLRQRTRSGAAAAARLALREPAHYVVFDVIHTGSGDVTALPYRERRAILEQLFRDLQLGPPWMSCPMTTSADQVRSGCRIRGRREASRELPSSP